MESSSPILPCGAFASSVNVEISPRHNTTADRPRRTFPPPRRLNLVKTHGKRANDFVYRIKRILQGPRGSKANYRTKGVITKWVISVVGRVLRGKDEQLGFQSWCLKKSTRQVINVRLLSLSINSYVMFIDKEDAFHSWVSRCHIEELWFPVRLCQK